MLQILSYQSRFAVFFSWIHRCHFRDVWEVRGGSVPHAAGRQSHGQTLPLQLFLLHELSPPPAGHAVLRQGWRPSVWGLLRGEQVVLFFLIVITAKTTHYAAFGAWIGWLCSQKKVIIIFFFHIKILLSIFILCLYEKWVLNLSTWPRKHMYLPLTVVPFFVSMPQSSLAVCSRCQEKITDRVLKAVGQCFHAHCFRCSTCSCVLEGAPFITDDNNNPYCVQDYHRWMANAFSFFPKRLSI